jgi:exopolysaccharide transport family protein
MNAFQRTPPEAHSVDAEAGQEVRNETVFDLTDLLRIVRVRQRIILGTAVAVVVLTAIVVFNLTPLYNATALVLLDERQNKVEDVDAVLSGLPTDPTSIENQVQILRSRSLLGRVIDKLHLENDPEFGTRKPDLIAGALYYINPMHWFGIGVSTLTDEQKAENERNKIIDSLLGRETIAAQGRSSAIQIGFEAASAQEATAICNAIADAYVEDQLNAKFDASQKATRWLADRIQQLSAQVQAADAAVQEYKVANGITETGTAGSVVDQQVAELNGQLITARADLAEQEAKYSRVIEMQRSGHAADVSQVVASPLIETLRGQESDVIRQEGQMASQYGPLHPKMLDIEAQKRNLAAKIEEEVARVVQGVASDTAVAKAKVGSLEASLNALEGQSGVQGKARIRLSQLEAAATSSKSLYEAFLGRFKEAQGQEGIQTPDARVISSAEVPAAPSFPNKTLAFGVAIPGGLLLGFLFAMLAERLDAGFRTTTQVERLLGVPVLTTLPEIPGASKTKEAADRVIDKPLSSFAESVRGLRMGLVMSNVDAKPKVVLVTSSVPDEGKTTVAVSLARLAAKAGEKVILVDCDLRRPSIANTLALPEGTKGVIDVLTGDAKLEDCVIQDPRSSAHVLGATKGAASPPDLLGSVAMSRLIEGLKGFYDLVVIDSAPLLPVNDTKIVAQLVDAVVFVVRWEKTPRDAVVMGARHLMDANAPVAGVVLSRADIERYKYYSYGYQDYYSYNKYYSD